MNFFNLLSAGTNRTSFPTQSSTSTSAILSKTVPALATLQLPKPSVIIHYLNLPMSLFRSQKKAKWKGRLRKGVTENSARRNKWTSLPSNNNLSTNTCTSTCNCSPRNLSISSTTKTLRVRKRKKKSSPKTRRKKCIIWISKQKSQHVRAPWPRALR